MSRLKSVCQSPRDLRSLGRASVSAALTLAVLAGFQPTATAQQQTAIFHATCGGSSLTLKTGLNASLQLYVLGAQPRVNAIIKYEKAYDPTGQLVFQFTAPGFNHSGLSLTSCEMTSDQVPFVGYTFDVKFLFTPVARGQ